jgi:hypothetical protein
VASKRKDVIGQGSNDSDVPKGSFVRALSSFLELLGQVLLVLTRAQSSSSDVLIRRFRITSKAIAVQRDSSPDEREACWISIHLRND